jgi:hypothetical protein
MEISCLSGVMGERRMEPRLLKPQYQHKDASCQKEQQKEHQAGEGGKAERFAHQFPSRRARQDEKLPLLR